MATRYQKAGIMEQSYWQWPRKYFANVSNWSCYM